jgi:hypothetical protein
MRTRIVGLFIVFSMLLPMVGCRSTNGQFYNPKTWTFYNPFSKESKRAAMQEQYAEMEGGAIPRPSEMSRPQLDVPQGGYQQSASGSHAESYNHYQGYNNTAAPNSSGGPLPYSSSTQGYTSSAPAGNYGGTGDSYSQGLYPQSNASTYPNPSGGYSSASPPATTAGGYASDPAVAMNPGGSYSGGAQDSLYSQPANESSQSASSSGGYEMRGDSGSYANSTGTPASDPLMGSYSSSSNHYSSAPSSPPQNPFPENTPSATASQYNGFAPGSIGNSY